VWTVAANARRQFVAFLPFPPTIRSVRLGLDAVAVAYDRLITEARGDFSALRRVESSLCIPRARGGGFIRRWFGEEKGLPKADMLVSAVEQGVPIAVRAGSNVTTALNTATTKA